MAYIAHITNILQSVNGTEMGNIIINERERGGRVFHDCCVHILLCAAWNLQMLVNSSYNIDHLAYVWYRVLYHFIGNNYEIWQTIGHVSVGFFFVKINFEHASLRTVMGEKNGD